MKISYKWIKEYVDVNLPVEKLASMLTMSGSEVKNVESAGSDFIMDIEITPNRSDCLSYIGIAREVSALVGAKVKAPLSGSKVKQYSEKPPFKVELKAEDLCPRYTARLIKDVKIDESPSWLKEKIIAMGLRPVNNVVDITNFVLFEFGQPLHAFDYDKIKDNTVVVRRAEAGEKILSIDNVERTLEGGMLVIADSRDPIAIAGVMGGLNTEVGKDTKNILLESAYFDPVSIRRTSFKFALMSESSYRFERDVDKGSIIPASERAAFLIAEICGGTMEGLVDKGMGPGRDRKVMLRIDRLNKILNLDLREEEIKRILSRLHLTPERTPKKGHIKVAVPSFRTDLKDEIDLIEEVARIYGYDGIDMTVPEIIPNPERKSLSWRAREKAAQVLTSAGLDEIVTYGLITREEVAGLFGDCETAIAIKNPLSAEQELMRPSLLSGMVKAVSYNINRGITDLKFFEMGHIYRKDKNHGYNEGMSLCIAMTGLRSSDWQKQPSDVTFFDLKGIIEALCGELGCGDVVVSGKKYPFFDEDLSLDIYNQGKCVGIAGRFTDKVKDAFNTNQEVFVAEIDFDELLTYVDLDKSFKDIPKYPSMKRDISLIAGTDISFEQIRSLVKKTGGELVEKIELSDKYKGKQIPDEHYGLTLRLEYRDMQKTLTSDEVDGLHASVREALSKEFGIKFR